MRWINGCPWRIVVVQPEEAGSEGKVCQLCPIRSTGSTTSSLRCLSMLLLLYVCYYMLDCATPASFVPWQCCLIGRQWQTDDVYRKGYQQNGFWEYPIATYVIHINSGVRFSKTFRWTFIELRQDFHAKNRVYVMNTVHLEIFENWTPVFPGCLSVLCTEFIYIMGETKWIGLNFIQILFSGISLTKSIQSVKIVCDPLWQLTLISLHYTGTL